MHVYLAMSTRAQFYQHPDGDYIIHIHTITLSKKPITQRQRSYQQAMDAGEPVPDLETFERERKAFRAQAAGEEAEGGQEDGEQGITRRNRQPR